MRHMSLIEYGHLSYQNNAQFKKNVPDHYQSLIEIILSENFDLGVLRFI